VKVMILAFAAALVIAFLAPEILEQLGWSTAEQGSSATSVRLD
jgi:hypothetical protein